MRLKKLYLHGYKTFANKTDIIFDDGVTAIVGPNGSGKSNIADAIRWVMGEQAFTNLRGKKTEDMIFNGSNERARMGMAEAVITLDNSDNWLPIDFDEVVIGRRAYRSGENEYFLNGSRVRLRDVTELLDRSGLGRRTHTVIGQGMIDQALALRPEDRRELFEEAAGITIYRQKRRQTIERLEKTQENLVRVHDILAELTPRLRQLERQAERASQYETISAELRGQLLVWYGHTWHVGLSRLVDARQAVTQWQQVIARRVEQIEQYVAETSSLRERQTGLRLQLAEWRRQMSAYESAQAAAAREQAVGQERLRSLRAESARLHSDLELLAARRQGEAGRQAEAEAVLADLARQRQEHQQQLTQAQAELASQEAERRRVESELTEARRKQMDFTTRVSDRENRIEQAKERRKSVQAERESNSEAAEQAAGEVRRLQNDFDAASAELTGLGRQIAGLRERHRESEQRRQELMTQRATLEGQRSEMNAQLRAQRARFDLLDRLRLEGEGLFAGVRQVMNASRGDARSAPRLAGVLGPIATLLDVPDHLEQAIEVALGARIQDVVVAKWADAEAAIAFLKQTQGGRATFLPLDNLRPPHRTAAPPDAGVLGWAADLIGFDAEVRPAVELLLGQVLVVADLAAARRINRGEQRPRIVTLEGDFVHPGGSVSGGSREERQKGGMLAREREWRSLPGQIETAEAKLHETARASEGLSQAIRSIDELLTDLVKQVSGLGEAERERTAGLARLQSAIDRARQSEAWRREAVQKLNTEAEALGRQMAGLRQEADEFKVQLAQMGNRMAALEEHLSSVSTTGLLHAVAQAQARLAAVEETRRSQQALVDSHRAQVDQIRRELSERQARQTAVNDESMTLEARLAESQSQSAAQDEIRSALQQQIEPAQGEVDRLEAGWAEHDRQGEALRTRLHQEEMQLSQAQLAQQRAEDHLTYLRSQIEHDFGLVAVETESGLAAQEPLPFDQIVTSLPRVAEISPATEIEIRRLKGLLNRLGPINPEAKAEYAATRERHEFLSAQAADLAEASQRMRQVIAELDQLIDQEFRRTFDAVAKAFTRYFTRLFGGGTAKLMLTDSSDITNTGVEIIARPPGKRPTSLAVLSGGERSLTAVALIFAILSVSPTPFCVFDEVDAALDESNVVRVREVLMELAREAQFILITHNRSTIEVADTIYGISMGPDSVSQALSLKLAEGKLEPFSS